MPLAGRSEYACNDCPECPRKAPLAAVNLDAERSRPNGKGCSFCDHGSCSSTAAMQTSRQGKHPGDPISPPGQAHLVWRATYDDVTPESAQEGDVAERGWLTQEGFDWPLESGLADADWYEGRERAKRIDVYDPALDGTLHEWERSLAEEIQTITNGADSVQRATNGWTIYGNPYVEDYQTGTHRTVAVHLEEQHPGQSTPFNVANIIASQSGIGPLKPEATGKAGYRDVIGRGRHGAVYAQRDAEGRFRDVQRQDRTARAEAASPSPPNVSRLPPGRGHMGDVTRGKHYAGNEVFRELESIGAIIGEETNRFDGARNVEMPSGSRYQVTAISMSDGYGKAGYRDVIGRGRHGAVYAQRDAGGRFRDVQRQDRTARAEAASPSPPNVSRQPPGRGHMGDVTRGKHSEMATDESQLAGRFAASRGATEEVAAREAASYPDPEAFLRGYRSIRDNLGRPRNSRGVVNRPEPGRGENASSQQSGGSGKQPETKAEPKQGKKKDASPKKRSQGKSKKRYRIMYGKASGDIKAEDDYQGTGETALFQGKDNEFVGFEVKTATKSGALSKARALTKRFDLGKYDLEEQDG